MSSKKEAILKLLDEGKKIEDLVVLGYNKKYVKEVIRNAKWQDNVRVSTKESTFDTKNDIVQIKNGINDIKNLLEASHWNLCKKIYENDKKNNRQTISDLIKVLKFLESNEQLLNNVKLEVNICIVDSKQPSKISENELYNIDELNPIEIYRDKGKEQLSSILHNYDITVLKKIARRYTPDSRGYVYKWTDAEKVINYIVERAENLSIKGSVFVTD